MRFVDDVLGDPNRAAEIEGESLDEYTERGKIRLTNPNGRNAMPTNKQLKQRIRDLEEENRSDRNVDIHHIDGFEEHGEHENLVWCCHACPKRDAWTRLRHWGNLPEADFGDAWPVQISESGVLRHVPR